MEDLIRAGLYAQLVLPVTKACTKFEGAYETYKKLLKQPRYCIDSTSISAEERMVIAVEGLINLKQWFYSKNISLEIYYATIQDIPYRINRYYNSEGSVGMSNVDIQWASMVLNHEMFEIKGFRFQYFLMDYKEIERSGYDHMPLSDDIKSRLPEGTSLINVHVKNTSDLDRFEEALETARHFFRTVFDTPFYAFITRTWLLNPMLINMIPASKIVRFSQRFELIAWTPNPIQALERIYGTSQITSIEVMEKHGRLQVHAWKHLEWLGVGCGIVLF